MELERVNISCHGMYVKSISIEEIEKFKNLQKFVIKETSIEDLPVFSDKFSQLKELKFNSNLLRNPKNSSKELNLKNLEKLVNLEKLSLMNNEMSSISKDIGLLKNLKEIDFSGNSLNSIPEEIKELQKLEKLFLDCNKFTKIPSVLKECKELKELDLSFNRIASLPDSFENFPKLERLKLTYNQLSKLPKSIEILNENIKILDLRNNPSFSDVEKVNLRKIFKHRVIFNMEDFDTHSKIELYGDKNKENIKLRCNTM